MMSEMSQFDELTKTDQASTILNDAATIVRRTVETLDASLKLSDHGLHASSLALCRTGLEQSIGNMLNLRESNLLWFYTFNTMDDAVHWAEVTRKTLTGSSDIAFIARPIECSRNESRFCVPVVLRNLMVTADGNQKGPCPGARLLAIVDRHRHEVSTSGQQFRSVLYPYVGDRDAVKDQQHLYKHHFTRRSLIDALRIHQVLDESDIEKLNRHYNYLSLFAHGTSNTDEYLTLRGMSAIRNEALIKVLIALYVFCILETELHSFQMFVEASPSAELLSVKSLEISSLRGAERRSWLGFVLSPQHPIDEYREKSYRDDLKLAESSGHTDSAEGYMRTDHRNFFDTNFLTRLNDAMSPTNNLLSGLSYTPPNLL